MFSIVSWNIQYGKGVDGIINLSRIVDVINQEGLPDVLCLQEVSRNDPEIDNGNDHVEELRLLLPNYKHFFGQSYDRLGGKKKRKQFGNLILSAHSPVQVLYHMLPSPSDPKARFMPRQVTEMLINTGLNSFRIMNTHLEFFSEKQQIAQVNRLREIHKEACEQHHNPGIDKPKTPFEIINRHEKMIICGDFNFTLESIPYKIMTESMPNDISNILDAWNILYPNKNRNPTCGVYDKNQWKHGPHCRDYFFISKILENKVRKFSVNNETSASDHQPIRLILDL